MTALDLAFGVEALRVLLLVFAGYCLCASAKGWWALTKGSDSPLSMNRAATFWTSTGIVITQLSYLSMNGRVPANPSLLIGLLVFVVGYGLHSRLYWSSSGYETWIVEQALKRPDMALPLIELADLDLDAASSLAQEARLRIAALRTADA